MTPYTVDELRDECAAYELMPPDDVGSLTFIVARLMTRYCEYHGLNYDTITEIRGALLGTYSEFDRCVAGPYEQYKRRLNGDVWGSLPEQITQMARSPLEEVEV